MADIRLITYNLISLRSKIKIEMKKISVLAMIVFIANVALGQSLDDIKKLVLLNKNKEAKVEVDKFLAIEKNAAKPDGWFYQGYAYDLTSKDTTLSIAQSGEMKSTAFKALKKYFELNPKAPLSIEDNNAVLFDLYVGFSTQLAVKAYMQKEFEAAFENFKKAIEVHDYIFDKKLIGANNYTFSALDTTLVLYTAISANDAKKKNEAAAYYKKITDANITDSTFLDAYQFQADYYKKNKDSVRFAQILEKGRKFFPKNKDYWDAIEIEAATDGVEKPQLFDKYEALMAKQPDNYMIPYNYAVELYRYIYSEEMKTANTTIYKEKLPVVLKKALAIKNTSEGNFLMANFLYNNSIDVQEDARKIKGPKPADLKRRKEMQDAGAKMMGDAIPYAEKVLELYAAIQKPKGSEKVNYRQSISILRNIYEDKKDLTKTAFYENKLKEIQ